METKPGITKEQWKEIETRLSSPYGLVKIQCDEYRLTLEVVCIKALKFGIMFYVDGRFLGKWYTEDCEERRRFFQATEVFAGSPKLRADLLKIYGGKRAPKAKVAEINRKMTRYSHFWTSAKALCAHLRKNNKVIELVSTDFNL